MEGRSEAWWRLTNQANRRCRSGAVVGDEKSGRAEWPAGRRGSVPVERQVRRCQALHAIDVGHGCWTDLVFANHNSARGNCESAWFKKNAGVSRARLFELVDETKTGGAKIVFKEIERRLTRNWMCSAARQDT